MHSQSDLLRSRKRSPLALRLGELHNGGVEAVEVMMVLEVDLIEADECDLPGDKKRSPAILTLAESELHNESASAVEVMTALGFEHVENNKSDLESGRK